MRGKEKNLKALRLVSLFIALYLALFTVLSYSRGNSEFLYYDLVFIVLLIILYLYRLQMRLSIPLAIALAAHGFLHLLGGNLYIGGIRLYDYDFFFLGYDNMVHAFGMFLVTIIVYNLLSRHLSNEVKKRRISLGLILLLLSMGVGATAELFELLAVLYFDAGPRVGDYFNNAFDLVYNALGSFIAVIWIVQVHYKKYAPLSSVDKNIFSR